MRLLVDHVRLTRGSRRRGTPGLGVSEPGSLLRWRGPKVALYSLCVLDGPAAEQVTPVVTEALHAEFTKSSSGSLTSCLLRAMRAAEYSLQRENVRSLPQHRCSGALCAAAVKDDTIFLAFVGKGTAYAWQDGTLRRLGGPDLGFDVLWSEDEWDIGLTSCRLEPGDAVILASTELAEFAGGDALAAAMARTGTTNLTDGLESLHLAAGPPEDFGAVVLQSALPMEAEQPPASDDADEIGEPMAQSVPAPAAPWEAPTASSASAAPEVRWAERPTIAPELAVSRSSSAEGTIVGEPSRDARSRIALPVSAGRIVEALGPSLVRVLLRFSVAAIIIAILSVGLYLGQEVLQARGEQAKVDELLTLLEQKERDALATTDSAAQRWLLTEASRFADQALTGRNVDERVVDAAKRIHARLDEVNAVARLQSPQLLADFAAVEGTSRPVKLLGVKDDLYVLDRGIGAVWHVALGQDLGALGPPTMLWRRGADSGGVLLGDATAAFWMYGGTPGLPEQVYALDSNGLLVPCSKDGTGQATRLPAAGALPVVRGAAGQAGNLYVLDTQRRLVWRYVPGGAGYDRSPQEYLTEEHAPGLANAIDMAVDGSLYLLFSDGEIVKYTSGRAQPFAAVVPDTPLRNPTTIFASPATRFLYVADAGNARVVRFTKEGQYAGQFRTTNDAFEDLHAVFVDEEGGRLYTIVGTRAFVSHLPADGKP